jgi:hypothetical protein
MKCKKWSVAWLVCIIAASVVCAGSAFGQNYEMGCLDINDNYENLEHGTLQKETTASFSFDVCDVPDNRPLLIVYVHTYWNKHPGLTVVTPDGSTLTTPEYFVEHDRSGSYTYFLLPAIEGAYEAHVTGDLGKYTFFFGAPFVDQATHDAWRAAGQ